MTKKDYELILSAIDNVSCELMEAGIYEMTINALADKLESDNPKFNRLKFWERAGMVSPKAV